MKRVITEDLTLKELDMQFVDSVQTCLKKYVDFNGRATRSEYWWFILFCVIVQVLAACFSSTLANLIALALFLPSLAVAIRRLHDVTKSGWFILIGLIPIIGFLVLIYVYIQPSTPGNNIYGPQPV